MRCDLRFTIYDLRAQAKKICTEGTAGRATASECARPRAQQAPTFPMRRHFPGLVGAWTLLRPGTGALRGSVASALGSKSSIASRKWLRHCLWMGALLLIFWSSE